MNYCLLKEAWGNNFNVDDITNHTNHKLTLDNIVYDISNEQYKTIYDFVNSNKKLEMIVSQPLAPELPSINMKSIPTMTLAANAAAKSVIDNLFTIIDSNKDIIVLILIGLFIILSINLINNVIF